MMRAGVRATVGEMTTMSSDSARFDGSRAVALRGVTKTFGETTAVDGLDLEIPRGALYGFIGPNGAGKTTSIRMIMAILFPDTGELEVLGRGSAFEARDRIGYLPEERGVYRKMKVGAYLRFIARLKGMPDRGLSGRIGECLERIELPGVESKRCEELSKGMREKIQFIAAIIHAPDLLILDEPFSGLDPVSSRVLRELVVAEHERGATILFSTHVMPQAEEICDHVVMIHRGRKVLDDPIARIQSQFDPRAILFEPLDPGADVGPAVGGIAGAEQCLRTDSGYEMRLREGTDPSRAISELAAALPVARVALKRPSLEDVFVSLVRDSGRAVEDEQSLRAELTGEPALETGA